MPFRTPLHVRHDVGEQWCLLDPLVFEGEREFFVMRSGFETDFASIPRVVRWLFDTAGGNSEPGVLHDALWRESKRTDAEPRVDPWDADGLFRRALRESGATALSRSLMWIAVRAVAIASGRFGAKRKSLPRKLLHLVQVVGMALIGAAAVGAVTIVAVLGRIYYWLLDWVVAIPWHVFERLKGTETNLPWPVRRKSDADDDADEEAELRESPKELLLIIERESADGRLLASMLTPDGRTRRRQ